MSRKWDPPDPLHPVRFRARSASRLATVAKESVLGGLDAFDLVTARRDPLIPPRRRMFDGTRRVRVYRENGDEFLGHLKDLCQLRPDADVLDLGSGMGRKARPLTAYLTSGSYAGVDIVESGVKWCTDHITARFPRFRFTHLDVANSLYNPTGRVAAEDMVLPFADASFDVVLIASVFTHMRSQAEVAAYLREVARVTRPGGRTLVSWFLLNDESRRLLAARTGSISFDHGDASCRINNERNPEEAVAFAEQVVRALYDASGLRIEEPVRYGSWCGRATFLSYQDLVVARQPPSPATG